MIYEYEVIYRESANCNGVTPIGEPKTLVVKAPSADQASGPFRRGGLVVLGVTELRGVVDWEKPVWDLDEFGAAMGIKGKTLSGRKGDGTIPWCSEAGGVPRRVAMKWIENGLNEPGRKILDELEQDGRVFRFGARKGKQ